jgi:ketosteroid isomerase-like protein
VQAFVRAWNARDMDAVREMHDTDVILRTAEGWPEPGPYVGREAVMREFLRYRETWSDDTLEPIGDFSHAADRVVVRLIWHGAGYGPESSMEFTAVFMMRKGTFFGYEFFWDHQEALEAVGLSEQDAQG